MFRSPILSLGRFFLPPINYCPARQHCWTNRSFSYRRR
nr:MAG TPA: hypothetical protein [Caudoviricetes sp.]